MEANSKVLAEENLREFCCTGNEEKVRILLDRGVNVNSANKTNGWTALHWAAKRGQRKIAKVLLDNGAETNLKTNKGETAAQLTKDPEIRSLLSNDVEIETLEGTELPAELPIIPNYLKNPRFIYLDDTGLPLPDSQGQGIPDKYQENMSVPISSVQKKSLTQNSNSSIDHGDVDFTRGRAGYEIKVPRPHDQLSSEPHCSNCCRKYVTTVLPMEELVLKVRVANSEEGEDYIEVELENNNLTYKNLAKICCEELRVKQHEIQKIRKLPNTIIRKDKDVARLQQFQELELVIASRNK